MRRVLPGLTRSNAVMAVRWLLVRYWMPPKTESVERWESFPELPGEHLSWHQTARGRSEIVTEDGRVLATVEGVRLFPVPGLRPGKPGRVTIGQVTYRVGGLFDARVTAPDCLTVVSFKGTNFDRQARAVAHMSDGRSLQFPVQGRSIFNAVMTATDDSGDPAFRLRQVRNAGPGGRRKKVVEIHVEPGRQITPECCLLWPPGTATSTPSSNFLSHDGSRLDRVTRRRPCPRDALGQPSTANDRHQQ